MKNFKNHHGQLIVILVSVFLLTAKSAALPANASHGVEHDCVKTYKGSCKEKCEEGENSTPNEFTDCTGSTICCVAPRTGVTTVEHPVPTGPSIKAFPDPLGGAGNINAIVKNVISAILFLAGAIFFVMFLWGGVSWIIYGGHPEKIQIARNRLVNAVIGLLILMASYGIAFTVIEKLTGAQSKTQGKSSPAK